MASLEDRIEELLIELGTDWKTFATYLFGSITGTLASLNTTDKSSFVAAINELEARPVGGGTGNTNLSRVLAANQVTITSDTGDDAVIPAADATNAGVMTNAMFTKLNGIETAADVTDAQNVGAAVQGSAAKATPVGADRIAITDSEAAGVLKYLTIANLTTFVIAQAGAGAPELLNTIDEIAAALGDNPDVITNLLTTVGQKADASSVYTKTEIDTRLGNTDRDLVAVYTTAKA